MSSPEARLAKLGLALPALTAPLANYVPWVKTGHLVFVAGQLPMRDGRIAYTGKVGEAVTPEQGVEAARQCLLNALAHLKTACGGDLGLVRRVVRLGGFVAATPGFTEHSAVMNGASDLAVAIFGDAGRHARATVGVASLPGDAAVQVDGIFELG